MTARLLPRAAALAVLVASSSPAGAAADGGAPRPPLAKQDVLSWPRASAAAFGCFLEKAFGVKGRRFNCAMKGKVATGDPCKNTKAYYDGPAFPAGKAREVHSMAAEIRLAWEHGDLQSVTVTLSRRVSEVEARKALRLPARLPAHVSSISVQQCGKQATCVILKGFDHMGAGEVECPPPAKEKPKRR